MKDKPKFTNEELIYIEKIMDINYSQGIAWLEKLVGIRNLGIKSKVEEELVTNAEKELKESQKATKAIRIKIENWRK